MLLNNRIIFKDNLVLKDLSTNLNNPFSGTEVLALVAAEDAIFIGSDLPFNHRYFELKVPNDQASKVSVALWDGSAWRDAVDVIDQTNPAGNSLAQDGVIAWVPDRNYSWIWQDTDFMKNSGLETLKIYGLYWAKLTFSGDLKPSTEIKYVGHKFSEDEDLFTEYPDVATSEVMAAFKAGKTDWHDQTIAAAEYIVQDLRGLGKVISDAQLLDWRAFVKASIHKTAEIIYRAFGEDYKDSVASARAAYKQAIGMPVYNIDRDANATVSQGERKPMSGVLTR